MRRPYPVATKPEMFLLAQSTADPDPAARPANPRPPRETAHPHTAVSGMRARLSFAPLRRRVLKARGRLDPDLTDPGPSSPGAPRRTAPDRPTVTRASGNRRLVITLLLSLGLHAAAATVLLLLLRRPVPVVASIEKPTEVELVMEERKGDRHPASAPSPPPPAPPPQKPSTAQVDQPPAKTAPPPVQPSETPDQTAAATQDPGPAQANPDQPAPDARPQPSTEAAAREPTPAHEPSPPAEQAAPVISLQGTDSPSNARAFGDRVIPARPDAVFHNRPPEYPAEAAMNGQQGVVVVMIHVSPAGTPVGVDLVRSSGYVLLDSAARDAVMRWRFLPAVKDGQPVSSDMTMGFEFDDLR